MIKLIIKLAIVALIANALWRVGSAYVYHYKFTDSISEATQFRGTKSDDQIQQQIDALAQEYDIPITDDGVTVHSTETHTVVDGSYTRVIELAPGIKQRWPFTFHIDTFSMTQLNASPKKP